MFADHLDSYGGITTTLSVPIQLSNLGLAIKVYIFAFKVGCVRIWQFGNVLYALFGLLDKESPLLAIAKQIVTYHVENAE